MTRSACIVAALMVFVSTLSAQEREENTVRGEVPSTHFSETRVVRVSLPPGYEQATTRYPVLLHLDGDSKFELVAGNVRFLARSGRIPEMIVLGVENPSSRARTRDLTPDADSEFPASGGAATMLRFVSEELLPWSDQTFRTTGRRILVGHSFGGLFTLHALATAPQLFDAYISAGASVWMADNAFLTRLQSSRLAALNQPKWLYFSAGEGDGGNTRLSNEALAAQLRALNPAKLTWKFEITGQENHFSNLPITLHRALMALFPIWGATDDLRAAATADPASVKPWFEKRRAELQWRDVLPDFELQVVGYELAQSGNNPAALAVFVALCERSPNYPDGWEGQGRLLERLGRNSDALAAYRRALQAANESGAPAYVRDRMEAHVKRLASDIVAVLSRSL